LSGIRKIVVKLVPVLIITDEIVLSDGSKYYLRGKLSLTPDRRSGRYTRASVYGVTFTWVRHLGSPMLRSHKVLCGPTQIVANLQRVFAGRRTRLRNPAKRV